MSASSPREKGEKQVKLGSYIVGKFLGKGAFGKVMMAKHTVTGNKVAVKYLTKTHITDIEQAEQMSNEFYILTCIQHPNVVRLWEVMEDSNYLYLFMEYAGGGTLDTLIKKHETGKLPEEEARKVFQQIIGAVEYCHEKNFIHRDLKPDNILLDEDDNVKIADFGLSTTVAKNGMRTGSPAGTPLFMAPEVLFREEYDDEASSGAATDFWSCGVILFKLVVGKLPFEAKTKVEMKEMVFKKKLICPPDLSAPLVVLIRGMLNLKPGERFSINEIRSNDWYINNSFLPHLARDSLDEGVVGLKENMRRSLFKDDTSEDPSGATGRRKSIVEGRRRSLTTTAVETKKTAEVKASSTVSPKRAKTLNKEIKSPRAGEESSGLLPKLSIPTAVPHLNVEGVDVGSEKLSKTPSSARKTTDGKVEVMATSPTSPKVNDVASAELVPSPPSGASPRTSDTTPSFMKSTKRNSVNRANNGRKLTKSKELLKDAEEVMANNHDTLMKNIQKMNKLFGDGEADGEGGDGA